MVMLCERGTTFGYEDLVVDPRSLIRMRSSGLPVVMDVTHCLQRPSSRSSGANGEIVSDGDVSTSRMSKIICYKWQTTGTLVPQAGGTDN